MCINWHLRNGKTLSLVFTLLLKKQIININNLRPKLTLEGLLAYTSACPVTTAFARADTPRLEGLAFNFGDDYCGGTTQKYWARVH